MTDSDKDPKVIVVLDFPTAEQAKQFIDTLTPNTCRVKIGKELFTRSGPEIVKYCQAKGFDVFLDLKFHDIPNTVAAACSVAAELGVWMVNVHAGGGRAMMQAARKAINDAPVSDRYPKPLLIAVTILTSHDDASIQETGLNGSVKENVERLAELAEDSGMDGIVCSAQEVEQLREIVPKDFLLVTPGIRPTGSHVGDQKRIMTPEKAMEKGSSYLVIGRPITQADEPNAVLDAINSELS